MKLQTPMLSKLQYNFRERGLLGQETMRQADGIMERWAVRDGHLESREKPGEDGSDFSMLRNRGNWTTIGPSVPSHAALPNPTSQEVAGLPDVGAIGRGVEARPKAATCRHK